MQVLGDRNALKSVTTDARPVDPCSTKVGHHVRQTPAGEVTKPLSMLGYSLPTAQRRQLKADLFPRVLDAPVKQLEPTSTWLATLNNTNNLQS